MGGRRLGISLLPPSLSDRAAKRKKDVCSFISKTSRRNFILAAYKFIVEIKNSQY
jgi:hypothetical protein